LNKNKDTVPENSFSFADEGLIEEYEMKAIREPQERLNKYIDIDVD